MAALSSSPFLFLALFISFLSPVLAQTWTDCDPTKKTCPNDPALGTDYTFNFTESPNDVIWNTTAGQITIGDDGGEFTIAAKLDSPTIQSKFYLFWGTVETHVKAAPGAGVVSSVVLQSDDLDEIDWEWIGSDPDHVQSNYFGKGNTKTYDRGATHDVKGATDGFHNYTTHWTSDQLEWIIDGNVVRTLKYEDAQGGNYYPQTPSNVRIGIWPAGDPKNDKGVIEWAGGEINYDAGPYTMYVKQIKVHDFSTGKEYEYGDQSGSFESIKIINGTSSIAEEINKPPPKSLSERWAELSSGAKIGIFCAVGGVVAAAIGLLAFCCIKQRRAGRREYSLEQSRFVEDQNNTMAMQSTWLNGKYQQIRQQQQV